MADSSLPEIWDSFREPLRVYVSRRVPDPGDVEDVLQDVFLKLHAHLGDLRDEDRLGPWLYRIARNAAFDRHRAAKRMTPLPEDYEGLMETHEPDAARAIARGLGSMIRSLPDKYREALILSELEELPQREVAQRLGLSLSGAKSRIQRGRRLLREALLECCHFEFDRRGRIMDYIPLAPCCGRRSPT